MKRKKGFKDSGFRLRQLMLIILLAFCMLQFSFSIQHSAFSIAFAAIPEADTIIYGKVINAQIGSQYPLSKGTLTWTIRSKEDNQKTYSFTTALEALQCLDSPAPTDGTCKQCTYSYTLKIPHEAVIEASAISSGVVPLTGDEKQYDFMEIKVDGNTARLMAPAAEYLKTAQIKRSEIYRIDLEIASALVDSDKDGIPDFWEDMYGLNKNDPADAKLDPDKDGWTNLQEYQNGGNPNQSNAAPILETSKIQVAESSVSGVMLHTLDSDSQPEQLTYTLKSVPSFGTLYLRDGSGAADAANVKLGKALAMNDTFTQADVNAGRVQYQHTNVLLSSLLGESFSVSVRDENPDHAASEGTVTVDIYRPSSADGSGASLWLDAGYEASGGRTAINKDTLWTDRSGPKPWFSFDPGVDIDRWKCQQPPCAFSPKAIGDIPIISALMGQFSLKLNGDLMFDLPYTDKTFVFPTGNRTLFTVFKSTGTERHELLNSAHFELSIEGDANKTYAGRLRYGTENWAVYSQKPVRDQWTAATVWEENNHATIELGGLWMGGPFTVSEKSALGTDPTIGGKVIWSFDKNINDWNVKQFDMYKGEIGEIIAFNGVLPAPERRKINYYLLSKWFGYVMWDGSAQSRSQVIKAPSGNLTLAQYQKDFVTKYGEDRPYILIGGIGDNTLIGGEKDDILVSGPGNNSLSGGRGRDIFVFTSVSNKNNTIEDFSADEHDAIDLTDLLKGTSKNLHDYLKLSTDGTNSAINISVTGAGSGYTDMQITLKNAVVRDDDLKTLWANGNIITGDIRIPLQISLDTIKADATEVTGDPAKMMLTFTGETLTKDLVIPFMIDDPSMISDYKLMALSYNATAGRYDYVEVTDQIPVNLKPGDMSMILQLVPKSDGISEPAKTVSIILTPNGDRYDINPVAATGKVSIQDGPDLISIMATNNYTIKGSDKPGEIVISRKGSLNVERVVKLNILGTAANGTDYEFIPSEVVIPSGAAQIRIPVQAYAGAVDSTVKDSVTYSPTKYVEMVLASGTDYTVSMTSSSAKVAIGDQPLTVGDVDGKNGLTLTDAISALQTSAGIKPPSVYNAADVNGDNRIGIAEMIYIMQKIGGVR